MNTSVQIDEITLKAMEAELKLRLTPKENSQLEIRYEGDIQTWARMANAQRKLREIIGNYRRMKSSLPIISVYGSTEEWIGTNNEEKNRNRKICQLLGQALAKTFPDILLLTGGTTGVPRRVEKAFNRPERTVQVLPTNYDGDSPKIGKPYYLGANLAERRDLITEYPNVAILITGGPGAKDEVIRASSNGALILVVKSSGGIAGSNNSDILEIIEESQDFEKFQPRKDLFKVLNDIEASPEETVESLIELMKLVPILE